MRGISASRAVFWAAFLACAAFLHFKNLGGTALWQDEAETAVLARNVLRYGLPKAYDGKNLVSQNEGTDHDANYVWNYSPWLGIYAAAASFLLFGESNFTARLPFALAGILALLLVHRMSLRWSGRRLSADLTLWLTLLSVPYLLYARQCRYYVLTLLFAFYLFYAYERMLESRPANGVHLVASLLGFFHSNFLVCFAAAGGAATHFILWAPRKARLLRKHRTQLLIAFLLLLPTGLYFHVFQRAAGDSPHPILQRWENLRALSTAVDAHLFPGPAVLLLIALNRRRLGALKAPMTYLCGGLLFLSLAPHHFSRYLLCFLPLFHFLFVETCLRLYERRRLLAACVAVLVLTTNAPSLSYWSGGKRFFRTELFEFLYETTHPFQEPLQAAARHLNEHAKPDDLLLVSYPDIPFMFYTPLRVIGGRSGRHRVRADDIRWVVLRDESEKRSWPLDFGLYEKIPLDSPNWPWGNRPDPERHLFRTARTPEPASIYRRRG